MVWEPHASIALLAAKDSQYQAGVETIIQDCVTGTGGTAEIIAVKVYSSQDVPREEISDALAVIFIIEADRGISGSEIETFLQLRDLQLPTVILVAGLDSQVQDSESEGDLRLGLLDQNSWDFDDMVTLCNRVLEPVITPYLVLHHEDGHPSGYFDLRRSLVIEYRDGQRIERDSDQELLEVVEEFQNEFNSSGFVITDFIQGNSVIAIPYIPERNMGESEVKELITMLLKAQNEPLPAT
jgi:hypothetical protein